MKGKGERNFQHYKRYQDPTKKHKIESEVEALGGSSHPPGGRVSALGRGRKRKEQAQEGAEAGGKGKKHPPPPNSSSNDKDLAAGAALAPPPTTLHSESSLVDGKFDSELVSEEAARGHGPAVRMQPRSVPSRWLWSPGMASWAVSTTLMMGFLAPEICAASFPKGAFCTFSALCVLGLFGAFSRSSSLYFFSSSRSDSLPREQIPRCTRYSFSSVIGWG